LGLDIDNATGVVSWAFECYQRKLLTEKDTDGLKLEWGDYEVVFKLFEKIAYRKGIGDILGEGSLYAAEYLDRGREFAITMKGQELYEEIRLPIGWGLGTCVSTRGGGHTTGSPVIELREGVPEICEKVYGITTWNNPTSYEGKAELVLYTERMQSIVNSLILCMFFTSWLDPTLPSFETLGRLYSAATGRECNEKDLIRIADRIINVEKAFNVIHGNLKREDDYPHERFLKEPVKSGRFQGFHLSKEKYGEMLDEYYTLHKWDPHTGLPKKKHLESLGLLDVAADLEEAHKIAG
jgi:aldehyde:ferredoxin oxidoreductase